MSFTELITTSSQPGVVIELTPQISVDTNFCIVNNQLEEFGVAVWGYLLFGIYAPYPVQEIGTFLSVPCYTRAHLVFHPFTVLSGLNITIRFYAKRSSPVTSITLWSE